MAPKPDETGKALDRKYFRFRGFQAHGCTTGNREEKELGLL